MADAEADAVLSRLRTIRQMMDERAALIEERVDLFERARQLGISPSLVAEASGETVANIRQQIHRRVSKR